MWEGVPGQVEVSQVGEEACWQSYKQLGGEVSWGRKVHYFTLAQTCISGYSFSNEQRLQRLIMFIVMTRSKMLKVTYSIQRAVISTQVQVRHSICPWEELKQVLTGRDMKLLVLWPSRAKTIYWTTQFNTVLWSNYITLTEIPPASLSHISIN